jgi:tetratricopeptide (TPR) repeat protein
MIAVIFYIILINHTSNGEHGRALEYYYQALERNPSLPSALNNIAVIYHYRGEQALKMVNQKFQQFCLKKRLIIERSYSFSANKLY